MKAVVECCAGIDIAKNILNVCVMTGAADLEIRRWNCRSSELQCGTE